MRRAIARGRVFPQSYSTDRRYGRLSLKACALFPLMWANADDQGRLPGDPEEIKYAACPNIDHISKADMPELLKELQRNELIKIYNTSKTMAIQLLDWWDVHRPQWAWPSQFPPPQGWQDHLRYKQGAKTVVTENWFSQVRENNSSGEQEVSTQASKNIPSGEQHDDNQVRENNSSGEQEVSTQVRENNSSGEEGEISTEALGKEREGSEERETIEKETERGKRKLEEERGNSPERSGERSPPSLAGLSLFEYLVNTFPHAFGRKPNSRETAQLRDLGKEISSAGGATAEQVYDAFKEACNQNKFSVRYVRAILLDWLGVPRAPP